MSPRSSRILFLAESLPEDGDVLAGAPDGRAILLGGLSPLAFPGTLGAPCFSMIQGGGGPGGSQGTRPSPPALQGTTLRAFWEEINE